MGRKAGISVRDVVDAAADVADAEGLDALTLSGVAERLGVRSPSLYTHVDGLAGLRRALALRAAGELTEAFRNAAAGRKGLAALRSIAYAYRTFAKAHPGMYDAAQRAVRPGEDDELYAALAEAAAPAVEALTAAGAEGADRIHLTRAFRAGLHGFVTLEAGGGFGMPEAVDESFRRLVDLLIAGAGATIRGERPGTVEAN